MIRITFCQIIFLLMSCASDKTEINTKETGDFVEKIVNFAIRNKDNQIIELPSLYDSLSKGLPAESKLILAESLKNKGFKEIESGRGNIPPRGPRIVSKIFHKDDCYCEVSKLYYFTTKDGILEMSERIKCMDKTAYEK